MPSSLNLTVTSPVQTFAEPLSLSEVKTFLSLPERSPADAAEDAMIEWFITAARTQAEILQGRDLVRKQWDLTLSCFGYREIELRDPLVSVDLVRRRDSDGNYTDLAVDTEYIVDLARHPGVILPPYGETWPSFTHWPTSAVLIRFTSGYSVSDVFWSDAGKLLKPGMLLLISHWFQGRLPFEVGASAVQEYPYGVTHCLSAGSLISLSAV